MQIYSVRINKRVEKQIVLLPEKDQRRVQVALEGLSINPFVGKQLHGELHGLFVIRVWPYRIMYEILRREIVVNILEVCHRKDVYRK